MRLWLWGTLVFVVTLLLALLFKLPFWLFVVVIVPLLIFLFTYVSFSYSFRESLQPEPIPPRGFSARVQALGVETKRMLLHGFENIDTFYLSMIPDAVVCVLKHKEKPVYLCFYHLGQKITCDFVTRYEKDYSLTTCNSVDGGMIPRAPSNLLQIITRVSFDDLYNLHDRAGRFLEEKGLKTSDVPREEFRSYFLASIRKQAAFTRQTPLWPFRLVIWTVMKRGRTYQREIEAQYKDRAIRLPDM